MIVEYHRPETLQSALELLSRKNPRTVPLGGGTHLSHYQGDPIAVVDLRKLGLGKIERAGGLLRIGSTATLQELLDSDETGPLLKEVVRFESNYNLRQSATVAGTLVMGDGKSALLSALLALDARLISQPGGDNKEAVEDWLSQRPTRNASVLITGLEVPCDATLKYEFVGRSPLDIPIVSVAIGEWPDGRKRIVIGGFDAYPVLALDGKDLTVVESSIKNACSHLPNNKNSEYILNTSQTLARRLLAK
jgi:CO/xanthine dehydrogenase FAD-binding subunit